MKHLLYYLCLALIFTLIGWFANTAYNLPRIPGNVISEIKPRPLDKYSYTTLSQTEVRPSKIEIGQVLKDEKDFVSKEFSFSFDPTLKYQGAPLKKVTGLINVPKKEGKLPVIVMFRGFVDQEIYVTGMGTQHAGEYFAKNGYITIAPDFLGYGGSDREASDIFETRFQTITTALTLMNSLTEVPEWDGERVSIWGHSNGGQVALSVLEITGKPIKTVLWAPNTAKFPYSILYYLDEASDEGKLVITELAKFMADYDVKNYSIRSYLEKINKSAKIEIYQGLKDEAVPVGWTDSLVKKLEELEIEVSYIKYPNANHNLVPSWNQAVEGSLSFFQKT